MEVSDLDGLMKELEYDSWRDLAEDIREAYEQKQK